MAEFLTESSEMAVTVHAQYKFGPKQSRTEPAHTTSNLSTGGGGSGGARGGTLTKGQHSLTGAETPRAAATSGV